MTHDWPPPYQLKRHARARYVKLRIEQDDGLIITAPKRFNLRELPAILEQHRSWIEKHLILKPARTTLPEEVYLQAIDKRYQIQYKQLPIPLRYVQLDDDVLIIAGELFDPDLCHKLVNRFIKLRAKIVLPIELEQVSQEIGLSYSSVTVREQKRVWGSCSAQKSINLNYKLILLPANLMRYVLIHELCHTKHLDHSERFWKLVEKFDPNWREHRRLLKKWGQA